MEETKSQQQREKDYLEEITKVHKIYQQEIENNRNFVETTRTENLKLAEIAKTYKENQKFLKKAYRHFEKDFKLIKMQLEISYNEQKVLIDENNHLKKLVEMQNEEKNLKSMEVDKFFQNASKQPEIAEKNLNDLNLLIPSLKPKKNNKDKNKRKSILKQWKEMESMDKNVDTCDLIITWESDVNTDVVYGAKNIVFLEKCTQTYDRNQYLRESRINETEVEEIMKENKEENARKEKKKEDKKDDLKEEVDNIEIMEEIELKNEENLIGKEENKRFWIKIRIFL
jgi:hypothetical protein